MSRSSEQCNWYAQARRRFRFILKKGKDFKNTIFVDMLYINVNPIQHVMDEAARYQAAMWLATYFVNKIRLARTSNVLD